MIDLHCHVLPGIDDGPGTIAGSLALARAAAHAGTRTIVATPHVNSTYRNDARTIAQLVDELNSQLVTEGIGLEVIAGAEVALSSVPHIEAEELRRLSLGAGPWLLVEPPFSFTRVDLAAELLALQQRGPLVLAHPERCPAFQRQPRLLGSLAREGVLLSVTAGSLVGSFGGPARHTALALMREGLVHNVASDAHNSGRRPPEIASALERAGAGPLAQWLTQGVPEAILTGAPIPPRPARAAGRVRRGGLLRRRRR